MSRSLKIGIFVALCCAFGFCAKTERNTKWVEIRTAHFRVLTDGDLKRTNAVGTQLECLREALGVRPQDSSTGTPIVIAFRRSSELREISPLYHGKPVEVEGLYQIGEDFPFIGIDLSVQALPHVIAHEYGHLAMEAQNSSYPVWLREGLSEYLSAATINEDKSQRKETFGSQIQVAQLFAVREDSREYNEESFHRAFYADASLAAEYFWTDPERKLQLLKYLDITRAGTPIEAAINQVFQMSSTDLGRAIRGFAAHPRPSVAASACRAQQAEFTVVPISDMDARAQIAELESKVAGRLQKSIMELEAILRQNPGHPTALRGMAYALWQSGDTAKAGSYFRLAANANPTDHRLPYLYSAMLRTQGAETNVEVRRAMQSALSTAIALKPEFADSHHWLSITYAWDGDFEAASVEATKAWKLDPSNDQFKFNLAAFHARAQHWTEARSLCEELRNAPDKEIASRAESLSHYLEAQ